MTLDELNALQSLRRLIEHEKERLAELRAAAMQPRSPTLDAMPHAPGVHDKIGEIVPRAVDLEEEIKTALEEYQNRSMMIHQWIETVPDLRVRLICMLRFEDGKTWEEVADFLDAGAGRTTADACKTYLCRYLKKEQARKHP